MKKYLLTKKKKKCTTYFIETKKENLPCLCSNLNKLFVDTEWKLFKETIQATEKLCSHIYQTFYKISFRPIMFYLEQVGKVKFNKETSDTHRFSPREYITQVI